jgi:hypothetical protein
MNIKRTITILTALLIFSIGILLDGSYAQAQAPGYVDIIRPSGGSAVFGITTIEGSASHPAFVSYDLSFAYPDDPTDTWFMIGDSIFSPVEDGVLGIWDTSGITDGEYRLRLRVHLDNEIIVEYLVETIRIRNSRAIETSTPSTQTEVQSPTPPEPTRTPRPTPVPPPPQGPNPTGPVFFISFLLGAVGLTVAGIYLFTRQRLRQHWGTLQMRRVLRQRNRQSRGGRRR